jgi:hypothetical protein
MENLLNFFIISLNALDQLMILREGSSFVADIGYILGMSIIWGTFCCSCFVSCPG